MSTGQNTLTEGSIWKKLLLFAFPIFLGNVFQQFYNTFDSWVVGNYLGDSALAAVSSSGSLIFLFVGFFNGVAMGAGVVIARQYGAENIKAMRKAIHTAVALGLSVGIVLTVLGVGFSPVILRWMGTPEEVLPESIVYFRYYFLGALFIVMYNIFQGILHAVGDSRHPLYYLIFSTIINIVLDLVLVGWLHMGVGAAALATTVSQGISALLCCIQLLRVNSSYKLNIREIRFDLVSLGHIIRFGLPAGIQNSVTSVANLVVQTNINSFGTAAMAGCGTYSKLEGFAFLPISSMAMSLATYVGQNLGAKKYDRVKKGVIFGTVCSVSMAELLGVFFWLYAPQLISFFNTEPSVIDFGTRHMRIICLFFGLLAFSHCAAGTLRGSGKAVVPMLTMMTCWCVIRVSYITIALRFVNELETVSWAYPLTWSCSTVVFLIYLTTTDWLHHFERMEARR